MQCKEKVTTSNHYNLTGSLCEKHVTKMGIEKPMTYGLMCQCSTSELSDHTTEPSCNSHKMPMVQPEHAADFSRYTLRGRTKGKPMVLGSILGWITCFSHKLHVKL